MTASEDRWVRVTATLIRHQDADLAPAHLCKSCAELLGVAGAGIILMAACGPLSASYSSEPRFELINEAQFSLQVGPAIDAFSQGCPAIQSDLRNDPPAHWFELAKVIVDGGIDAVFSLPLQIGATRLGALTWYQAHAGGLDEERFAAALVAAEVVTHALISFQAGVPNGLLASVLAEGDSYSHEVHQAAGMISIQLGVTVGTALVRLRAWAYANDLPVAEAAALVVNRTLSLED